MFDKFKSHDGGQYEKTETTTTGKLETITVPPSEKKEKSKKHSKKEEPKLAKNTPKELHATGKFFGGIAELKIEKTDLELFRTQRIIFESKGKRFEYTRTKRPY